MPDSRFRVGDLVQIDSEYREGGNPSLFRIRHIARGVATLGQLSSNSPWRYIGTDTAIELDDPDLRHLLLDEVLERAERIGDPLAALAPLSASAHKQWIVPSQAVVNGNEQARNLVSYFVGQGVGLVEAERSCRQVVQDFREEFAEAVLGLTAMLDG